MANERLKAQDRPSDEILNAFVDGEFSPEDRLGTLKAIASSEQLSREVCDMHQLKELVSMAYEDVQSPQAEAGRCRLTHARRSAWFPSVAAGVVALVLGSLAGFELTRDAAFMASSGGRDDVTGESADLPRVSTTEPATESTPLPPGEVFAVTEGDQILLHINDADTRAMAELLNDIENMYRDARAGGRGLNVQVVVHNNAMDLVRADRAPYPERVAALVESYPGLRFTACTQTLERLAKEEGQPIEILPQAERIDSGVAEAARRQAEGWIYIKV